MMTQTAQTSAQLQCDLCGYDLRAHPPDGKCPECGASVAESQRLAAIPRRPAWRESDPRWRRRMLAGAWVLVLLPLMDALNAFGWASSVPAPNVFGYGAVRTLDDTFLSDPSMYSPGVYPLLVFCIGVVLLFSKERGRRGGRLDWTRRWGVLCSYVVLLLGAAQVLFLCALVSVGVAAMFQSMPLKYQPPVTRLFVEVSTAYLRYGPHPTNIAGIVLVVFSSVAILLACIGLFDALRSSGSTWVAAILLAPLALFSLIHLAQVGRYCLGFSMPISADLLNFELYFRPQVLQGIAGVPFKPRASGSEIFVEAAKWCIVLGIAVWLSIAQLAAWRRRIARR
jgi:hypothetical protein